MVSKHELKSVLSSTQTNGASKILKEIVYVLLRREYLV